MTKSEAVLAGWVGLTLLAGTVVALIRSRRS